MILEKRNIFLMNVISLLLFLLTGFLTTNNMLNWKCKTAIKEESNYCPYLQTKEMTSEDITINSDDVKIKNNIPTDYTMDKELNKKQSAKFFLSALYRKSRKKNILGIASYSFVGSTEISKRFSQTTRLDAEKCLDIYSIKTELDIFSDLKYQFRKCREKSSILSKTRELSLTEPETSVFNDHPTSVTKNVLYSRVTCVKKDIIFYVYELKLFTTDSYFVVSMNLPKTINKSSKARTLKHINTDTIVRDIKKCKKSKRKSNGNLNMEKKYKCSLLRVKRSTIHNESSSDILENINKEVHSFQNAISPVELNLTIRKALDNRFKQIIRATDKQNQEYQVKYMHNIPSEQILINSNTSSVNANISSINKIHRHKAGKRKKPESKNTNETASKNITLYQQSPRKTIFSSGNKGKINDIAFSTTSENDKLLKNSEKKNTKPDESANYFRYKYVENTKQGRATVTYSPTSESPITQINKLDQNIINKLTTTNNTDLAGTVDSGPPTPAKNQQQNNEFLLKALLETLQAMTPDPFKHHKDRKKYTAPSITTNRSPRLHKTDSIKTSTANDIDEIMRKPLMRFFIPTLPTLLALVMIGTGMLICLRLNSECCSPFIGTSESRCSAPALEDFNCG